MLRFKVFEELSKLHNPVYFFTHVDFKYSSQQYFIYLIITMVLPIHE